MADRESKQKVEIERDLEIGSDLDEQFRRMPGLFFHYAYEHARAEDVCRRTEEAVKLSFAKHYAAYKKKYPDSKENEAKSYVERSAAHKEAQAAFARSKFQRDVIKAGVEAFRMKKDMLVQLGADRRAEYEGTDLKTRARRASKVVRETYRKRKGAS